MGFGVFGMPEGLAYFLSTWAKNLEVHLECNPRVRNLNTMVVAAAVASAAHRR